MTEHPDVALPAAMIEAAARALHDADCSGRDCTTTVIMGSYGWLARAALVAALGVCEVEWCWIDPNGAKWSMGGPEDAVWWAEHNPGGQIRRSFTEPATPAEPVDTVEQP